MPRKSTSSSNSAGGTVMSMPSNISNGAAGPGQDGDVSMLSVATDASTTATSKPRVNGKTAKEENDSVGIDDLLLPRTLTSRLARGILPANTSIQKDALLALTKAATVFINYLAHNANELTQRKTVGPQDVLKAIEEIEMAGVMGLGQVGPDGKPKGRLERELEAFENVVKGKRKGYREKVKARESGTSHPNDEGMSPDGYRGGEREAKRARFENGAEDAHHSDGPAAPGNNLTTMAGVVVPSSPLHNQRHASPSMAPPLMRPAKNDARPYHLRHNDFEDEQDDNAEDEQGYDDHSDDDDGDEDQTGGEDEEEEDDDDDEEVQANGDDLDLDGYGPDDQLRPNVKGSEVDDDDDDDDGSEDGSD